MREKFGMGAKPQWQHACHIVGYVVLGLGVFIALLLAVGLGQEWWASAYSNPPIGSLAYTLEHVTPEDDWLAQLLRGCRPENLGATAGLALAFSLLFAFNLSFWGHVRRVCASPRRWRGRR